MSSIYKKLDKIDDKESLSEKYNITSLQYFNKQRKLNEGKKSNSRLRGANEKFACPD